MFYPNGKGQRVMTKEMFFYHFNDTSLAALIISCGFILNNTYIHWLHGLSLTLTFKIRTSPYEQI